MKRLRLCISEAHPGIQAAVKKEGVAASSKRCKVHFMRNILARIPQKEKARLAEKLKQIWLQPDRRREEKMAELLVEEYGGRFPEACRYREEGLEDSLVFYSFPEIEKKCISSTNVVERICREIGRRSWVIGFFLSISAYMRLIVSYLLEASDDWVNTRSYI